MPYLGNTPSNQAYAPLVEYFSGNASATVFTLARPVASPSQIIVVVNNVPQNPYDAFTVSGTTLTFSAAPSTGTNNIWVEYTSLITTQIAPGQGTVINSSVAANAISVSQLNATGTANGSTFLSGNNTWQTISIPTVTPASVSDSNNTATGYFALPAGTTAQRPSSPVAGQIRFNTTFSVYESYNGTAWQIMSTTGYTYTASYLIVAGGAGGGGGAYGGGGGAGGLLSNTTTLTQGATYSFVVGSGGTAGTSGNFGSSGANSTAFSLTAIGGGGGASNAQRNGASGGSGGGGASGGGAYGGSAGGSGTSGQGNNGGGGNGVDGYAPTGGGGGAGAVGGSNSGNASGAGGVGIQSTITGAGVYYAGGGGGSNVGQAGGAGGTGGGGRGSGTTGGEVSGTANTGGGGGGCNSGNGVANGGSGVVIISVPTSFYSGVYTGSNTAVTTAGSNTILSFYASGTYTA